MTSGDSNAAELMRPVVPTTGPCKLPQHIAVQTVEGEI